MEHPHKTTATREGRGARRVRPRSLAALTAATAAAGVLLLAGLPGSAGANEAAQSNLLTNPGFENGLSGWNCDGGAPSSNPVRSGSGALAGTPAGQSNARCEQQVSVVPGSEYQLSAWVRGGYAFLGAEGAGLSGVSTWTPGAGDWQQLNVSFTAGPSTSSVTVYLHGWYGTETYYADDAVLSGAGGDPTDPDLTDPDPTDPDPTDPDPTDPDPTDPDPTDPDPSDPDPTDPDPTDPDPTDPDPTDPDPTDPTDPTDPGEHNVPRHAVTGYWHNFDNDSVIQKLRDVPDDFDIIAVSFADATTNTGEIEFNLDPVLGYGSEQEFKDDIAAKQAQGKSVIISVGGEVGNVIINDPASAQRFSSSTLALMDEYGFDGVDIDLEHGINAQYLTQAMEAIYAATGDSLVYTMAPQTIDMQNTGTEYFKLALNTQHFLTVVNMQYYNSGSMLGCDGQVYSSGTVDFLTALACIQLENGLDASQVGIGVPASPNAAGSGYVSPSVVTAALDCLTQGTRCGNFTPSQTYPDLRGAMTWSTNWDAHSGYAWSSVVGPHVRGLP